MPLEFYPVGGDLEFLGDPVDDDRAVVIAFLGELKDEAVVAAGRDGESERDRQVLWLEEVERDEPAFRDHGTPMRRYRQDLGDRHGHRGEERWLAVPTKGRRAFLDPRARGPSPIPAADKRGQGHRYQPSDHPRRV